MSNIRASLYGRLGGDPKPIPTQTGKAMTRASLAVDVKPWNTEAGDTEWVTVLAFGRLADGAERSAWQLVADDMHSSRTARPGSGKRTATPEQATERFQRPA